MAITAMWRGPAPADPGVRAAAERLAHCYLGYYRQRRRVFTVFYPVLALFWVALGVLAIIGHDPRHSVGQLAMALTVGGITAWEWYKARRIQRRLTTALASQPFSRRG